MCVWIFFLSFFSLLVSAVWVQPMPFVHLFGVSMHISYSWPHFFLRSPGYMFLVWVLLSLSLPCKYRKNIFFPSVPVLSVSDLIPNRYTRHTNVWHISWFRRVFFCSFRSDCNFMQLLQFFFLHALNVCVCGDFFPRISKFFSFGFVCLCLSDCIWNDYNLVIICFVCAHGNISIENYPKFGWQSTDERTI